MVLINRLPELDEPKNVTWKKDSKQLTNSKKSQYQTLDSLQSSTIDAAIANQINDFTSYIKEVIIKIEQQKQHMSVLCRRSAKEQSQEAYGNMTTTLDNIISQVSILSNEARIKIEEFKDTDKLLKGKNVSLDESNKKVILNLISIYSEKLNDSVFDFTSESEKLKKSIQNKLVKQAKVISNDFSDQQIHDLIKSSDPAQFMRASVLVSQDVETRIGEIEKTHEEIVRIENGIAHVKNLFETLKFLVDQHQDVIDNVESNIINTKEMINKGEERLKESKKNVNRGNYITIAVIGVILIIAIVLIIIFA